ncbi:MAG TPA: mismatch-specific DNA-glycosylase [Afipia sp.]
MNQTAVDILEELLAPNLKIVFCGTAAGTASAKAKSYYAHHQNKFWKILFDAKLTPVKLESHQFRNLANYRIGLTDLLKHHSGMDHQLPLRQLRDAARARLRPTIEKYRPTFLAFTSITAGKEFLGGRRKYGEQIEKIAETKIWILPSTSGAANGHWKPEVWHQFTNAVRAS